jgi:hypothetical protein
MFLYSNYFDMGVHLSMPIASMCTPIVLSCVSKNMVKMKSEGKSIHITEHDRHQ